MIKTQALIKALKTDNRVLFSPDGDEILLGNAYFITRVDIKTLQETLIKAGYYLPDVERYEENLTYRYIKGAGWYTPDAIPNMKQVWSTINEATVPLTDTELLTPYNKTYAAIYAHDNGYVGIDKRYLDIHSDLSNITVWYNDPVVGVKTPNGKWLTLIAILKGPTANKYLAERKS